MSLILLDDVLQSIIPLVIILVIPWGSGLDTRVGVTTETEDKIPLPAPPIRSTRMGEERKPLTEVTLTLL